MLTDDIKKGNVILLDGEIFAIMDDNMRGNIRQISYSLDGKDYTTIVYAHNITHVLKDNNLINVTLTGQQVFAKMC